MEATQGVVTVQMPSDGVQEMFWLADALFWRHVRAHKRALRKGDTKAAAEAATGLLAAVGSMKVLHRALHPQEAQETH